MTKVFRPNHQSKKPIVLNKGGGGSSKSYTVCQILAQRLSTRKNYKLLITRKTLTSLLISTYPVFEQMLKDYGIYRHMKHNQTRRTMKMSNGNFVHYTGVDDTEKIKSTDWNDIWMEECNEFTFQDFIMLQLRNRAQNYFCQMWLTLNPVDEFSWVKVEVADKMDCDVITSTYKDNPYLPEQAKKLLENLINIDKNYHKIYALGQWGGLIKGRIFSFETYDIEPKVKWITYGLDWGYTNDPTSLVRIGYTSEALYLEELCYETGLTNQDISAKLIELGLINKPYYQFDYINKKGELIETKCYSNDDKKKLIKDISELVNDYWVEKDEIIADSAEPKSIEELYRQGWNVKGANKGPDSIVHGIDIMKRYKLRVHKNSVNLQKEFNQYKYSEDKNGTLLNKPIDMFNHCIDAIRYVCLNKIVKKKKFHIA